MASTLGLSRLWMDRRRPPLGGVFMDLLEPSKLLVADVSENVKYMSNQVYIIANHESKTVTQESLADAINATKDPLQRIPHAVKSFPVGRSLIEAATARLASLEVLTKKMAKCSSGMDQLSSLLESSGGADWKKCADAYTDLISLLAAEKIEPQSELATKVSR